MVVVLVHVVDVGEWCGGVVVVASSKGVVMWHQQQSFVVDAELNSSKIQ
jgi:hypothetical protein